MNNKNLKKILDKNNLSILVTRIDHIGDTLLYTPALSALRKKYPRANITVLSSSLTHEVLRGNADIDEIICYDEPSHEFYDEIKSRKFDVILNFSAAVKDFIEASKFGGNFRIAPVYKNMLVSQVIGRMLLHRAVVCEDDPGVYMKNPDKTTLLHEVEQNEKVVSHLYAEPTGSPLILPVFPEDESFADDLLFNKMGIPRNEKIIALQISDRWFYEGYREKGISNLIRALSDEFPGFYILCLSYPGIEPIVKKVMEITGYSWEFVLMDSLRDCPPRVEEEIASPLNPPSERGEIKSSFNASQSEGEITSHISFTLKRENISIHFASNIPLKKYAAVLKRCELLVTMHSGATHISAAMGLPSVVVFNSDYFEYFSYREKPWKVEYRAVKKKHNDDDFMKLQDKEKERSVDGNIVDIIDACKVLLSSEIREDKK